LQPLWTVCKNAQAYVCSIFALTRSSAVITTRAIQEMQSSSLARQSKSFLAVLLFSVLLFNPVFGASVEGKPTVPRPVGFVNDYAKVLDEQSKNQLTALSQSLAKATGAQMVFVIMPSIAPYDEFTYGQAIFDTWGIGQKGKDNGLLFLIAIKERRLRIHSGYGVEGVLPDGKLGRYRDQYLVPYLKKNQMGAGLVNIGLACAQDLAKAANVKLQITGNPQPVSSKKNRSNARVVVMLVLLVLLGIVSRINRRRMGSRYSVNGVYIPGGHYRSGGGGFGGGFSGFGGGFSGGGGVGGGW
jgi:uncharacterized protein